MAVTSGFFNSVNGDRKYNAEQIGNYFGSLISSGVLPNPSTNLQVMEKRGMTVAIKPGRGFIDSHWINNTEDFELTIDTADPVLDRIDCIIMRLDLRENVRDIHFEVKKGVKALVPAVPKMERTSSAKEYCLAQIKVNHKALSLTQANITDTRANTAVCGWVTALIKQVDTTTLFLQWQTAYEAFYEEMKGWNQEQQREMLEWIETVKDVLGTVENGELLRQLVELYENLYKVGLDEDIDAIIGNHYLEEDETGGIFSTATNEDIDNIIGGSYIDQEEEPNVTDNQIKEIVNQLF